MLLAMIDHHHVVTPTSLLRDDPCMVAAPLQLGCEIKTVLLTSRGHREQEATHHLIRQREDVKKNNLKILKVRKSPVGKFSRTEKLRGWTHHTRQSLRRRIQCRIGLQDEDTQKEAHQIEDEGIKEEIRVLAAVVVTQVLDLRHHLVRNSQGVPKVERNLLVAGKKEKLRVVLKQRNQSQSHPNSSLQKGKAVMGVHG